MGRNHFLVSHGGAVAFLSILAFSLTGAPTSLIGVAMGLVIAAVAWRQSEGSHGITIGSVLVALLLVQSIVRLLRIPAESTDWFGSVFFATLAAMSLTTLLVMIAGRRHDSSP